MVILSSRLLLLLTLMLSAQSVLGVEFFFSLVRDTDQCFEEHLSGETLVTGEVFFDKSAQIAMWVLNPQDHKILLKVWCPGC